MRPNSSQEFYDWLADEAIEVLIQDRELQDLDEYLSCDVVKAWKNVEVLKK